MPSPDLTRGNENATRVVLVDAEPERPPALTVLESRAHVQVVAAVSSLSEAEQIIRELRPSVVLIDVLLPLGPQRELMERMHGELPTTHFVALTPSDLPEDRVLFAVRAGALGFVERETAPDDLAEAIATVSEGEPWLPNRAGSSVLLRAAHRLELTPRERTNRMGQIVLGAIPIAAVLGAALGYMIRTYWGQIGVRTEDLGVGTDERLVDILFLLLLAAGAFGPLVFVPSWTRALRVSGAAGGRLARVPAPVLGIPLAVFLLLVAAVLLAASPVFLALVVGPLVLGVVAANAIGFSDQLPPVLALEWTEAKRAAIVASGLAAALLLVLGIELWRGPDIRHDGLHGFLAPDIMGDDVAPVRLTGTGEPFELEAVLLGAVGSRYVLYDPCGKVVVHVPSGLVTAEVIDAVRC